MFKRFLTIMVLMITTQSVLAEPDVNQMLDVPSSATIQNDSQDSFLMSTAKTVGTGVKEVAKTGVVGCSGFLLGLLSKRVLNSSMSEDQILMILCNIAAVGTASVFGAELAKKIFGDFHAKAFITSTALGFMIAEYSPGYRDHSLAHDFKRN